MDAGKIIADFLALLEYAQERYATAYDEERNANDETQDILHSLEFEWYDTRKAARLARKLSEIRQKRRQAKNDMEIVGLISDFVNSHAALIKALQRLQSDVQTTKQDQAQRPYHFRTEIMEPYFNENALTDAGNIGQSGKES